MPFPGIVRDVLASLYLSWVSVPWFPNTPYRRVAQARRAVHLFQSTRLRQYSTRRIRQISHAYALAAGIQEWVYPHRFRHQIITFLTKQGLMSPKLQPLSGHAEEKRLAMYRDLALADATA